MEFSFDVREVLPDPITRVSKDRLPFLLDSRSSATAALPSPTTTSSYSPYHHRGSRAVTKAPRGDDQRVQRLAAVVNKLGAASAKAQGLRVAVTTYLKLMASSHTLYLLRDEEDQNVVVGILKVGRKNLFLRDQLGIQREVEPLCVLDFYVHESRQRAGHGWRLFQAMLNMEKVRARELAIDRPSTKFLSFLRKHHNLHSDIKQGNNFVVFSPFFQSTNTTPRPISSKSATVCMRLLSSSQQEQQEVVNENNHENSQEPSLKVDLQPPQASTDAHDSSQLLQKQLKPLSSTNNNKNNNKMFGGETVQQNWTVFGSNNREQHCPTPYDIISGVPLATRERYRNNSGMDTPLLLTMRDKQRGGGGGWLKGGSRLGLGGPYGQLSVVGTSQGHRLARDALFTGAGGDKTTVYSRHSLHSIPPHSHNSIPPATTRQNRSSIPPSNHTHTHISGL